MPYTIQGNAVSISPEPFDHGGVIYVPLRDIVTQLGGKIEWDNNAKTAAATVGQWTANVQMANETVDVNGQTVTLEAPPFVDENGELFVPATFFQHAYGYKVSASGEDVSISL